MRRREFIATFTAALAWPTASSAQRPAMRVIGVLHIGSLDTTGGFIAALHRGLSESGYVEGRNLAVEYRWAEYHFDRLPALAAELVRRQVAVIVAVFTPAALAAKAATTSIPIVFLTATDPVETGLVVALNRPGGNLTGFSSLFITVSAKQLEFLHELIPSATTIAFLANPNNVVDTEAETRALQAAARTLGVRLLTLNASNESEIEAAFASLIRERAGGLVVGNDALFRYPLCVELAARHKVPTIAGGRSFAEAGGLMSYGTDFPDTWRLAGGYAARILKGDKPTDLPVQQVTKLELVINLKTANALGLTIPLPLIGRADAWIE